MGKKRGGKKGGDKQPEAPKEEARPSQQPPQQLQASDFPSLSQAPSSSESVQSGSERGRGRGRGRGIGRGSFTPSEDPQRHLPQTEQPPTAEAFPHLGSSGRGAWGGTRHEGRQPPTSATELHTSPPPAQSQASFSTSSVEVSSSPNVQGGRGGRGRGRGRGTISQFSVEQPPVEQPTQAPPPSFQQHRGGPGARGQRSRGRGGRSAGMPPDFASQVQESPTSPVPPEILPSSSYSSISESGKRTPYQAPSQQPQAHDPSRPQPVQQAVPPQQMKEKIDEITKGMASMGTNIIPSRKKKGERVGERGRPIRLEVNHLALTLKKTNMVAIHYDVSFKPDSPKRLFRLVMQNFQKQFYPKCFPAFDGRKNLYSCGYLPGGQVLNGMVTVWNEESFKDVEFEVTVKVASKVDMSPLISYMNFGSSVSPPQEALQAIDIVLRNPAAMRFVPVGRSFFTPPPDGQSTINLGDGLELWYGFYQSAILGWKPFLNVDVAHKGFPKPEDLIKVIENQNCNNRDFSLHRELDTRMKETLQKYIGGLKVEYEIPGHPDSKRTYKVNRVMDSSVKQRFDLVEKTGDTQKTKNITIGQYLEVYRHYKLQYPYMPCLHVGPPQRNIYIPVELCRIAKGQALAKKLNETQTAAMVKNAAQPADIRKKRIMEAIRMAKFNSDPCVQEFGITVADNFTPVNGRVLAPPSLLYSREQKITPSKGVWRAGRFLQGTSLNNWCILNMDFRTRDDSIRRFASEMSKIGRDLGVSIDPQPNIKNLNHRFVKKEDIIEMLKVFKGNGAELVVVIIPDSGDTYGKVKQSAELTVGILTQCVKAKTVYKLSPATVSNILLKVNSKLNGINHTIGPEKPAVLKRPVMIVGADVTHPSPDQTHIPSVAAVAASHDPKAFQYNMLWRLQRARQEIIEDLENIMAKQLMFFYKKTNGYKPERIFFYRDGVSEGQFSQVLNSELTAIRRACKCMNEDFRPKITFLVVQKRHHTRFFPTRPEDQDGKNKNVPAGTIVDTTITHPTEFDFYLVSHASIQGTSRPTKYHLLWDDNDMAEDDLEELTYYLCHLFSRCTRSVSYPAPTYYAHLAAFRARVYLDGSKTLTNLAHEQRIREIQTEIVNDSPMFFV